MVVDAGEAPDAQDFPLPPSTPIPSTYPCQLGTQHAKDNFRPRKFKRIPSGTENEASLLRTLRKYWGHDHFRGPQLDICLHALRGCDVLVVAPTGLGKSVCFQVPALTITYGITVVVSPLLSLMRDQVASMRLKGIKAYQLGDGTPEAEIKEVKRQLRLGHPELRLLYVTPESLFSTKYIQYFKTAYRQQQLVRLVVDEAHVIDEWGSSFRSKYRELGNFRKEFPDVPITALTASATRDVRDDILTIMNMPKTSKQGLAQWVEPFNRKNLFYEVRHMSGYNRQQETIADLISFIRKFNREAKDINERNNVHTPCITGLVYCRLTADCETVAAALCASGITAKPFYAKKTSNQKNAALDDWKHGRVECIVATIAFGMGVDAPHVRYVVHYDFPKSFEGYYQETGRAGRDGHMSRCVLYYAREDAMRQRNFINKEIDNSKRSDTDQATIDRGKLRTLNSFKALQHYAEAISLCRHINICRYFGEQIKDPTEEVLAKYCDGMCDICTNRAGVYRRSMVLSEEVETASPIVQPTPVESTPEYQRLSSQRARNSLAVLHASSAVTPTGRRLSPVPDLSPPPRSLTADDYSEDDGITDLWLAENGGSSPPATPGPAPIRAPRPSARSRATPSNLPRPPRATESSTSRRLLATPQERITPRRLQTLDEMADDGLMGAVVVLGDTPTPEYAEQKRKARENAFKGVTPARAGGPLSFYNTSDPPKKKAKVAATFKTPFLPPSYQAAGPSVRDQPGTPALTPVRRDASVQCELATPAVPPAQRQRREALFLPGPSQFGSSQPYEPEPPTAPPTHMPPQFMTSHRTSPDAAERESALHQLREALQLSFGGGALAEEVLEHWDRYEVGDRRLVVLKKVARELELDIAKMALLGEPYHDIVDETCAALKLVRDARGVSLVVDGRLGTTQDPRVERLRHVEQCMRGVRVK